MGGWGIGLDLANELWAEVSSFTSMLECLMSSVKHSRALFRTWHSERYWCWCSLHLGAWAIQPELTCWLTTASWLLIVLSHWNFGLLLLLETMPEPLVNSLLYHLFKTYLIILLQWINILCTVFNQLIKVSSIFLYHLYISLKQHHVWLPNSP